VFLLAYRNLRSRTARTVLTSLAIALGAGMIFAMRIVGTAINESARAGRESHEELNKTFVDQDILLTELTYKSLGEQKDKFEVVDLGEVEIRGKSQKMRVYGLK
jgi:class 3 adenylate cyclase